MNKALKDLPKHLSRLQAVSLFATLNLRELRLVESLLHEREYLAGEVVFDAGEEGQAIYIVFSGKVAISKPGEAHELVAELGPGTFFGEIALLDNAERSAQAQALAACRLGVLFRTDFQNLLETDARTASKIAMQLARHLGRRLRRAVFGDPGDEHR
jgi:CRP/FNR family cyclic AMP-dependent transcriptional regulator